MGRLPITEENWDRPSYKCGSKVYVGDIAASCFSLPAPEFVGRVLRILKPGEPHPEYERLLPLFSQYGLTPAMFRPNVVELMFSDKSTGWFDPSYYRLVRCKNG